MPTPPDQRMTRLLRDLAMNRRSQRRRQQGLILLVVLGMLSLLSLLAVSYVVFSSQSRNASAALIKRDFRNTPHEKLLDDGLRQILRGTTDPYSVAWRNDLLGDLYGSDSATPPYTDANNDLPVFLKARYTDNNGVVLRDNPQRNRPGNEPYNVTLPAFQTGSPEGPQTFPVGVTNPQFLKIPIAWNPGTEYSIQSYPLPEQSDAWNGRVITFIDGPLANKSFRIVRYVGEVAVVPNPGGGGVVLDPEQAGLQYSITIDLSDLLQEYVTVRDSTGKTSSQTISSWLSSSAASLLYADPTNFSSPYTFMVNSGVMNSYGMGVQFPTDDTRVGVGYTQTHPLASTNNSTLNNLVPEAFLPNHAAKKKLQTAYTPSGDTDEPWDACDFQNFLLALKQQPVTGSSGSDDIIPSFHRPAVINYLVRHAPNLNSATPPKQAAITRLHRTCFSCDGPPRLLHDSGSQSSQHNQQERKFLWLYRSDGELWRSQSPVGDLLAQCRSNW